MNADVHIAYQLKLTCETCHAVTRISSLPWSDYRATKFDHSIEGFNCSACSQPNNLWRIDLEKVLVPDSLTSIQIKHLLTEKA